MNKLSWAENTYCNDFLDRSSIYPKSAETPSLNIKRYVQRYPKISKAANWLKCAIETQGSEYFQNSVGIYHI